MSGTWEPPQFGLSRALLVALGLEIVAVVLLLGLWHRSHTPALPPALPQQVTTISFVKLPTPVPITSKVVPLPSPPKPVTHKLILPKIVPLPPLSKPDIVIPKRVRHRRGVRKLVHKLRPVRHLPVVSHPAPRVVKSSIPKPHVALVSGPSPSAVAAYAEILHTLIQNNVVVSAIISQLGLFGSVQVRFTLGPRGGHVLSAQVLSTGINRTIRQAALNTVEKLSYPPFPKTFGTAPRAFEVIVQIERQ